MTTADHRLPLAQLRVLDLCTGAGASAARFLADLGADVIVVESPQNSQRVAGPDGTPANTYGDMKRAARHANKRSIVLDLVTGSDDLATFWELARSCDIVFEDSAPGNQGAAVNARTLQERLPDVVTVSVTGFGQSGPYRDWIGGDAVYTALSGELSQSGLPGRQPLIPPARIATEVAAAQAAWCALVAYADRIRSGRAQFVDFSILEAITQTLDPAWGMGGSASGGQPAAAAARDRPDTRNRYPIYPCADGHVRLCILSPRQWQAMFRWLGEPADLADPALMLLHNRFAAAGRIDPAIVGLFSTRTRAQIVAEGREHGVPAAAVLTPSEVFEVPQFRERNAFIEIQHGDRTALLANGMVEVDGRRAGIRWPAPKPDADRADILASLAQCGTGATDEHRNGTPDKALPLSGIRVLDLGVIVAGAEVSRLFADMGAEVIKIENNHFPDGVRQTLGGEPISVGVAWGLRNKESLGLNLRTPEGVEVFKDLVAHADVVLSNFKPGTMEQFGLAYEQLAAINPGIVVADSSAYGPTGPWSSRMGYGPLVRAETGVTGLWRYPDDAASFSDATTIYPDHTAGRVEATAVLAMLLRRNLTGRGGRISVAQAEIILNQTAAELAVESLTPGILQPVGNALPGDAPRGVYPARGDDDWVVVDVHSQSQFAALAHAIGHPEWVEDQRFCDATARTEHRQILDDALTAWTTERTPTEAANLLQDAGVPAAMMLRATDLLRDPQFVERGFFRTLEHPLVAQPIPTENHPAVFSSIADAPLRPAPLPGEQSREVLHRILGYDHRRIDALVEAGVVEEAPAIAAGGPVPAHP